MFALAVPPDDATQRLDGERRSLPVQYCVTVGANGS